MEVIMFGIRDKMRRAKKRRLDILIALLEWFKSEGRDEVSLLEINKSINKLEQSLGLGYKFLDKILYSDQLMEDLHSLDNKLIINQYSYTHNGFLPRSYISLTSYGIGTAKELVKTLPQDTLENIAKVARESAEDYEETLKFFARPARR